MRFDLDEPLFPLDDALPGLLTGREMDALIDEWKATKIDEWCAVAAVNSAAAALRSAVGLPAAAPIEYVLTEATRKAAGCVRVARALTVYEHAATRYEGVRVHLADVRNRTTIPAA